MKQNFTISGILFSALSLNFIFTNPVSAQTKNLVENPGFEASPYPVISSWPGETQPGKEILPGWVTPTRGTADFYNSDQSLCDGFSIAKARTGQGRVAMILGLGFQLQGTYNYKEYIQGKFMEPLEAGKKYCVKFYAALDHASQYTATGIGAYLSKDPIRAYDKEPLPVSPQINSSQVIVSSNGWVEISGTYTAKGGEKYITIGNFSDVSVISLSYLGITPEKSFSSQHIMRAAYFYIDDVSVTPDDGKPCDCAINDNPTGDYFLFLIDISGSMNKSGKFGLMKEQIKNFAQNLNENNRLGIMAFSDNAKILLPFLGPADSVQIDTTIDHLKSHGVTNGDLAIHRVSELIDSMHLPQRCHVIIATDGIFNITELTKNYADSVLNKNKTSFCVLQFGNKTNEDLKEMTVRTPQSSYNFVSKRSAPKILEQQLPPPMPDPNTVYYTDMSKAIGNEMMEGLLEQLSK